MDRSEHSRTLPRRASSMLSSQGGVISTAQLLRCGASRVDLRAYVRDARLFRVDRGLYSERPPTWLTHVWAGLLRAPDGAIGGWHALALERLRVDEDHLRSPVLMWTTAQLRDSDRHRFRRDGTQRLARATGQPRRIDVVDAVLDLCAASSDAEEAAALVLQVVRRKPQVVERIGAALEQRGHRDRRYLRHVLGLARSGVESVLEARYVEDVEEPHGLPTAQRQAVIRRGLTLDNLYEGFALAVEADGERWHRDRRGPDASRDRELLARGIACVRLRWADIAKDPCRTAAHIAELLQQRGWTGQFRRCLRCPPFL